MHFDSLPAPVAAALARAEEAGFQLSCDPTVGRLLGVLAGAVPEGARIVELGTGAGVGLAWIVHGLGGRRDVEVVTVDLDAELQERTREAGWPAFVRFVVGDGAEAIRTLGGSSLVFADAPGGKLTGLSDSVAALAPGGLLLLDDMDLSLHEEDGLREALRGVRAEALGHPDLVCVELAAGSGILLAHRKR